LRELQAAAAAPIETRAMHGACWQHQVNCNRRCNVIRLLLLLLLVLALLLTNWSSITHACTCVIYSMCCSFSCTYDCACNGLLNLLLLLLL
jgi:hypothetical protein